MKPRWILLWSAAAVLAMGADMTIRQAQEILKAKGYYKGEVDGLQGPQTEEAISQFQREQGIKVTGNLDEQTAKQLNASMPGETYGTIKGAGKSTAADLKHEGKSAWQEIKGIKDAFSSGTKTEKQPPKQQQ